MVRKLGPGRPVAKTLPMPSGVYLKIVSNWLVTKTLSEESIARPNGWKLVLAKRVPVPSGVNFRIVSLS